MSNAQEMPHSFASETIFKPPPEKTVLHATCQPTLVASLVFIRLAGREVNKSVHCNTDIVQETIEVTRPE